MMDKRKVERKFSVLLPRVIFIVTIRSARWRKLHPKVISDVLQNRWNSDYATLLDLSAPPEIVKTHFHFLRCTHLKYRIALPFILNEETKTEPGNTIYWNSLAHPANRSVSIRAVNTFSSRLKLQDDYLRIRARTFDTLAL